MQITLTHNSELRARKVEALHRTRDTEYPVSGDNHTPAIGERVEIIKHGRIFRDDDYRTALGKLRQEIAVETFKDSGRHVDLTHAVNVMNQETLF